MEIAVNGLRGQRTHAEHGMKGVGTRPEVADRTQVLKGMALLLQREIRRAQSFYLNALGLQLKRLLHAGRQGKLSCYGKRAAQANLDDILEVIKPLIADDLQVLEICAVVELDEGKGLAVAQGLHPALHGDDTAVLRGCFIQRGY